MMRVQFNAKSLSCHVIFILQFVSWVHWVLGDIEVSLKWREQWDKLLGSLYQGYWLESQMSIPTHIITTWDLCPHTLYSILGETISVFLCLVQGRHSYIQKSKWLVIVPCPRVPQYTYQTLLSLEHLSLWTVVSIMDAEL